MRFLTSSPALRPLTVAVFTLSITALAGCHLELSTDVEQKDEWTRTYPLTATGSLAIKNGNGRIEVTGGDGSSVVVVAERIVKAGSEAAAKEQLGLLEMKEEVSADRVSIDSSTKGLTINVTRRVNYKITMPRGASLALASSNGDILVKNIAGTFTADASNGRIVASGLSRGAKVSTSNGVIELNFDEVGADGISAETTNGTIEVAVPRATNADLTARVTNGAINHEGLDLKVSEQSRRRLDGTLGSGGPSIRLETTNGAIAIRGKF